MTTSTAANVHVCDHPLVKQQLTKLRDYQTPSYEFRRIAIQMSRSLAYEALRDLSAREAAVETPVGPGQGVVLDDYVVIAPILRAGLVLAEAAQELIPANSRVYHVGLKRDEATLQAISYYAKLPDRLPAESKVYILDPMLATGGSANAAIQLFHNLEVKQIHLVCFLAAPEGIKKVHEKFPNVKITTASIDSHLNEHGFIVPGLGDAGDRIFGT
ncbi:MAG: uracil phosphoribosyltransferase [Candidatus Obscuribacterales bacterium]|nr:uracil phosphoribosyltransferase [Candidatus Obscuribacterales bacterium]